MNQPWVMLLFVSDRHNQKKKVILTMIDSAATKQNELALGNVAFRIGSS